MYQFIVLLVVFSVISLAYFWVANYFNIIDKPNERSSHTQVTIRGGGIIFPIAWILYSILNGFILPWATLGLVAIAIVSFVDDRMALSTKFRFFIHLVSFTCCFLELNMFLVIPWWVIPIVYVVGIGCVNAVNFMDGINGMTGLYSLSVLLPVQYYLYNTLWNGSLLNYLMLGIMVFGFYNFRKRALFFAGDVGSVSMGYIMVFILLGFIFNRFDVDSSQSTLNISKNIHFSVHIEFILLLTLYGIDVILTLVQRLYLKENIFEAHRKHFYQLLCNEFKKPHVLVSMFYAIIQIIINVYVFENTVTGYFVFGLLLILTLLYAIIKHRLINSSSTR